MTVPKSNGTLKRAIILSFTLVVGLASCATGSGLEDPEESTAVSEDQGDSDETARQEGVPAGATKEEYITAFESIEPIQLTTQTPGGKGTASASYTEAYAEALSEWSGGKLTMEIGFGNSIVPESESEAALIDGRLSMDRMFPVYEPSKFPKNAEFSKLTSLGNQSPIFGSLSSSGALLSLATGSTDLIEEVEKDGVKVLLAYAPQTANNLMCREPIDSADDLSGLQVRVATSGNGEEAKGIGLTPVSMPYGEVYEALQRGAIDCLIGQIQSFYGLGVTEVAPYLYLTDEGGFGRTPNVIAFSQVVWDELPLVAQQLLWDRLDVFIQTQFEEHVAPSTIGAVKAFIDGGEIGSLPDDAVLKLEETNDKILRESVDNLDVLSELGMEGLEQHFAKWEQMVGDLGYSSETPEEIADHGENYALDLNDYISLIQEEILNQHRPR